MTATCAESATNAESRTSPASGSLPTPERAEKKMGELGSDRPTTSLARMERLGGDLARWAQHLREHPEEPVLNGPVTPVRELGEYYLVSILAGRETYAYREKLKALHLRWSPLEREWTGVVLGPDISTLRELGLAVEVRDGPAPGGSSRGGAPVPPAPLRSRRALREPSGLARKRDQAKASVEAYAARGVQGRESARLSLLDVTAGLPDDSRDMDERVRARAEREREGRVAAALAALEANPVARAQVYQDQTRCARFCAQFSVSTRDICPHAGEPSPVGARCGWCRAVHNGFHPVHVDDVSEVLASPMDWLSEVRAREAAVLPVGEWCDG